MRYARRGYPIGCEYGPEGETVDIGAERRPGWGRGEVNQKKKRTSEHGQREQGRAAQGGKATGCAKESVEKKERRQNERCGGQASGTKQQEQSKTDHGGWGQWSVRA